MAQEYLYELSLWQSLDLLWSFWGFAMKRRALEEPGASRRE